MSRRSRWTIRFPKILASNPKVPNKHQNIMKHLVLALLMVTWVACGRTKTPEPGFDSLFDGQSLQGWLPVGKKGNGYLMENGVLICPASGGGRLFTEKKYTDFVLRFEFCLQEGSNNGIGIRSPLTGDPAYQGLEIQILDNHSPRYKDKLRPTQYHGSIYDLVPARRGFLKPTGEWNQKEIRAIGRQIAVTLNGTVIVDFNLDSVTDSQVLEKHPGVARNSGHISFLGHGTKVEFRNVRIKEIH